MFNYNNVYRAKYKNDDQTSLMCRLVCNCLHAAKSGFIATRPLANVCFRLRVIIYKHQSKLKMTCLRFSGNVVYFLLMSIKEEKWTPFFSQHARFHGNQENLLVAYFDYIYSGSTEIKVMVIFHKSICQVLYAAYKKSSILMHLSL